jgi:chromosomal replication initiation ATPase DnaA
MTSTRKYHYARDLATEVSARHGFTWDHVRKSRSTHRRDTKARWDVIKELAIEFPDWSKSRIGGFMNGMDHTTISNALNKMGVPWQQEPREALRAARRAAEAPAEQHQQAAE